MSARSIVRAHRREQERRSRRAIAARRLAAGTAAALSAGAIAAGSAEAATFGVSNLSDSGPGSLRQAIADANGAPGADTITFQSGLSGTINVGAEMSVTAELAIDGPGASTITLDGGDTDRILHASNTAALSVSGLTLTNGDAGSGYGGAIQAGYGQLSLDGVVITSSSADSGGGVSVNGNDVSITNSRFAANDANHYGGGLALYGHSGAGATDAITITGSTFTGNTAAKSGGGISLYESFADVTIDATSVMANTVTGTPGENVNNGGGIWFEDVYSPTGAIVSNSTVSGNSAADAGGGISFGEGVYSGAGVINSTITDNEADFGGGIQFADMVYSVPFTLTDSTVTGNEAIDGGGVLQGNSSIVGGGSYAPLDISSSIVAANTASGTGPDIYSDTPVAGPLTIGNALLGDVGGVTYTPDPAGSNIVGAAPQLGPLTNNGGPTETMLPAATSPAINAGLANGLTTDQRGDPRTVAYPGVPNSHGSDGTDIGAAELGIPAPPDTTVTDPYLEIESPQVEGKEKVKVEVTAGAGELVNAEVWGKIFVGKGNAVMKSAKVAVSSGQRTTITVVPKKKKATRRILKALANGRKVTAKLTGKLADEAGNEYSKDLQARLKPKG